MSFPLFVTWNVCTVVFHPIFVCWLTFLLLVLVLSELFQVAVISLLFYAVFQSLWRRINTIWMLVSTLPPFLDTYSLSTPFLCIVTSFLVLLSICRSSSVVHLMNSPEYLMRGQPSYLSVWCDLSYVVLFRVVFSFSWLKKKNSSPLVWWCPVPILPSICNSFLFSECSNFFLVW